MRYPISLRRPRIPPTMSELSGEMSSPRGPVRAAGGGAVGAAARLVELLRALRAAMEGGSAGREGLELRAADAAVSSVEMERWRSLVFSEAVVERAIAVGAAGTDAGKSTAQVQWSMLPGHGLPEIAVIGPTQTGKSTIVNAIIGAPVAEASPLAGFTRNAHAFLLGRAAGSVDEAWFPGFRLVAPAEIDVAAPNQYTAQPVANSAAEAAMGPCLVWDTPDFDSLLAAHYHTAVLAVAARADAHVFVLSKEKYADLLAWRVLALLAPLQRPLVVVVNKLTLDARGVIPSAVRSRLSEAGFSPELSTVVGLDDLGLPQREIEVELGAACGLVRTWLAPRLTRRAAGPGRVALDRSAAARLMRRHWDDWNRVVREEHEAAQQWCRMIQEACSRLEAAYERDFLSNPRRYDSFRRAAVALLELLEIPGVSAPAAKLRQIVTWPVRTLIGRGQRLFGKAKDAHEAAESETALLRDALEALLVEVRSEVGRRSESDAPAKLLWRELLRRLDARQAELRSRFDQGVQTHATRTKAEIQAAAELLYETLQEHPIALQSLRAARATADVGGLLLALKTGGLHLHDLLLAPAMFGLTSLMTEGALGAYMARVESRLKQQQRALLQSEIIKGLVVGELGPLVERLDGRGIVGISPAQLQEADCALRDWEGGE